MPLSIFGVSFNWDPPSRPGKKKAGYPFGFPSGPQEVGEIAPFPRLGLLSAFEKALKSPNILEAQGDHGPLGGPRYLWRPPTESRL